MSIKTANLCDMGYLRRTQCVEAQGRIETLKFTKQLFIELDAQFWMHSALQQQLIAAKFIEAVNLLAVLLDSGYKVFLGLVRFAVEVAEEAARGADIGGIDIAVNLPGDNARIGHHLLAQHIGLQSNLLERCGAIEHPRLVEREWLAVMRFAVDIVQGKHTTFCVFSLLCRGLSAPAPPHSRQM